LRCHDESVTEHPGDRARNALPVPPALVNRAGGRTSKKIPRELRRTTVNASMELSWHRRLIMRFREDSQFLRSVIQAAFIVLCIWIGVEFHFFVKWGLSEGTDVYHTRPPGVEGFLPISALISLKYWLQTGVVNRVHPSGMFILLAVVGVSLALKKAFCSWLCPIGTLSESLWMLGRRMFKRNLQLPRCLDYPLRSLKYILLFFFGYSIWTMDVPSLQAFIFSPYNKMADVKMYLFFAEISTMALWTVIVLAFLSVVVKNFWCRFLCPYGALLGIVGWLSPLKVTRNLTTCIDCELCTKACPANINVHHVKRVWSDECTSCLSCVEACPVKQTLDVRVRQSGRAVPNRVLAGLVAGVFIAVTGLAILTGNWQNSIHREEYQRRFKQLDSPAYQHFRGKVPAYGPND
jgi:Pyruvate/2-oxoacid:ferredoxin oxidoreductase delta subunit